MNKIYMLLRVDFEDKKIKEDIYLLALERLVSNYKNIEILPWYCDDIKKVIQSHEIRCEGKQREKALGK